MWGVQRGVFGTECFNGLSLQYSCAVHYPADTASFGHICFSPSVECLRMCGMPGSHSHSRALERSRVAARPALDVPMH